MYHPELLSFVADPDGEPIQDSLTGTVATEKNSLTVRLLQYESRVVCDTLHAPAERFTSGEIARNHTLQFGLHEPVVEAVNKVLLDPESDPVLSFCSHIWAYSPRPLNCVGLSDCHTE